MDEEGEPIALRTELDDGHLPDPAHPDDLATRERVERRLDALQRDHPGGERGFDLGALERGGEPPRGDLDLR